MISPPLLLRGHLRRRKYPDLDKVLEMYLFHLGMIHLLLIGLDLLSEINTLTDFKVGVKSLLKVKGTLMMEIETEREVRATIEVTLKVKVKVKVKAKTEVKAMQPVNIKRNLNPKTELKSALLPHEDSPFLHLPNPSPLYPSLLDLSPVGKELNNR